MYLPRLGNKTADGPSVGRVGEPTVQRSVETIVPGGTESGRFGEGFEYMTLQVLLEGSVFRLNSTVPL
jgi:hypothetical protein